MAARDLAPLFIVGAPRSGTSLLYKLLCLHPRAAWISNWGRRAPGQPALAMLNRLAPRLRRRLRRRRCARAPGRRAAPPPGGHPALVGRRPAGLQADPQQPAHPPARRGVPARPLREPDPGRPRRRLLAVARRLVGGRRRLVVRPDPAPLA